MKALQFVLLMLLAPLAASANIINLSDYVNNPYDEHSQVMSQVLAQSACSKLGMRLPTIRELADLAVSRGALIQETAYPGVSTIDARVANEANRMYELGYTVISKAKNGNCRDSSIDFYYKNSQYRKLLSDRGDVWTSSADPLCPLNISIYYFDEGNGGIRSLLYSDWLSARCTK